jgi:hypothetical protein
MLGLRVLDVVADSEPKAVDAADGGPSKSGDM